MKQDNKNTIAMGFSLFTALPPCCRKIILSPLGSVNIILKFPHPSGSRPLTAEWQEYQSPFVLGFSPETFLFISLLPQNNPGFILKITTSVRLITTPTG